MAAQQSEPSLLDLRAELAVARAENEQLLQQMSRLALVVEQHTPYEPIEVMHGRYAAPPAASDPARAAEAGTPPRGDVSGVQEGL